MDGALLCPSECSWRAALAVIVCVCVCVSVCVCPCVCFLYVYVCVCVCVCVWGCIPFADCLRPMDGSL